MKGGKGEGERVHVRRRTHAAAAAYPSLVSPRWRTTTALYLPALRIVCHTFPLPFLFSPPLLLLHSLSPQNVRTADFPPCPCSVSARPSHVDAAAAAELVNCKVKGPGLLAGCFAAAAEDKETGKSNDSVDEKRGQSTQKTILPDEAENG